MDTGLSRSHLYSACLLSATVYYEPGDRRRNCRATGFIAQYPSREGWGLVTNRHVGDPVWRDPKKFDGTVLESLTAEIWLTTGRLLKYELTSIEPVFHDDPTVDVCVFPVDFHRSFTGTLVAYDAPLPKGFSAMSEDEQRKHLLAAGIKYSTNDDSVEMMPQHFLSWDFLEGSQQYWSVLDVGEMAFFPGYPAWFDKIQRRPVMRSGVIMGT